MKKKKIITTSLPTRIYTIYEVIYSIHIYTYLVLPLDIPIPDRYVFIGQPCGYVKHDYGALPVDIITISQPSKLLLPSCIPTVESDGPSIRIEVQRGYLHSNGGYEIYITYNILCYLLSYNLCKF